MENGGAALAAWNFAPNDALLGLTALSVGGVLGRVRPGMVEGSDAGALRSGEHNSYAACIGLEPARMSDSDLSILSLFFIYTR